MTATLLTEDLRAPRKISRGDWDAISARYDAGESLAKIGRDYNCTAPAIRYILHQQARLKGTATVTPDNVRRHRRRSGKTTGGDHAHAPQAAEETRPASQPRARADQMPASDLALGGFEPGLRDRITVEISVFLVAFETVMAQPTDQDLDRLRDATDRLMRAAARVRIELDRVRRPATDNVSTTQKPPQVVSGSHGGSEQRVNALV